LLICPILDYSRSTESRRDLASGYLVDQATLDHDLLHYAPPGTDPADLESRRCAPTTWALSPAPSFTRRNSIRCATKDATISNGWSARTPKCPTLATQV